MSAVHRDVRFDGGVDEDHESVAGRTAWPKAAVGILALAALSWGAVGGGAWWLYF